MPALVRTPRLTAGDLVALVSPGSWSADEHVAETIALVESWGLRVRLGAHATDRWGYMAGADDDRLDDLNTAVRDPEVRALLCLRGGCGSLRLTTGLDVQALRSDPKPIVGFSDVTTLLQVWHRTGVISFHGGLYGDNVATARDLLFGEPPAPVPADRGAFGADLTRPGRAEGPLFGGNLEMLARTVGVADVDLRGHVLLLEILRNDGLGMVDRALTQLMLSGALEGITGVALGGLTGFEDYRDRGWTVVDLLRERLEVLDVPVLAGLPIGHVDHPVTVPLGAACTIDTAAGLLAFDLETAERDSATTAG